MPKVTTKDARKPLQEAAPAAMEVGEEELPSKPMFSALTAKEQNGMKVEFRRVSERPPAAPPGRRGWWR
jgi:hypothetical protein